MRFLLLVLLTVHSQEPVAETRRNLIQCDRKNQSTTLVCGAPNGRLISQGFLMGNELSIIIPNASSSQQGFYELHVVANGAFDPPIGCYLFVEDKAGAQPGEGESGNTMAVVIPAVIVLAMLLLIVPGIVFILRRRKHVKRVHSKTIHEEAHTVRGTSLSLSAPEIPDSGYSTPVDKTDSSERGSVMLKTSVRSNDNDGQLTDDQTAPVPEPENSRDDQSGAQPTETDGLLQNETDPSRTNSEHRNLHTVDPDSATAMFNTLAAGQRKPKKEEPNTVAFARASPLYAVHKEKKNLHLPLLKQRQRPTDDSHRNKGLKQETIE